MSEALPYENSNPPSVSENAFDFCHYIDLVLRHRWLIILSFCLAMLAGIFLAIFLPKSYEAKTLILVEPQKVPSDYVKAIVSSDINARISTISQQIMSRTNLQKIIKEYKLFSGPKYKDMFLEDKLKELRKRITVDVSHSTDRKRQADSFSITFRGKDPQKVMQITNTLATYFINQNIKVRESNAIGTKSFLADELEKMRKRLEKVEGNLKEYRRKYMGELPEQLDSNLRMLDHLQEQLSQKQQLMRDDRNRLAMLESQIQIAKQEPALIAGSSRQTSKEPTTLEGLKRMLADYQLRYTPHHPDVIRLKKKIREMEAKGQTTVAHAAAAKTGKNAEPAEINAPNKAVAQLIIERDALKREIKTKKVEIAQLLSQIKFYQQRVENTPKREQELLALNRNYSDIKTMYNSMQERKLEADIAVSMEKKQKGEQFRIIDPAITPQKPVSPNMKRLFLLCVALGLGIGAGIVFLIDFFDHSLSSPDKAELSLGIPTLATIPKVVHPRDVLLRRLNLAASIIGVLFSIGLLAGFAAVSILNYEPAIGLLSQYIKFS